MQRYCGIRISSVPDLVFSSIDMQEWHWCNSSEQAE